MPENSKEVTDAIRAVETKFRIETLLMKWGASEAAAKLLASSDEAKKFVYDGVDLRFGKSDLTASDDPNARAHFVGGPFKGLFAAPADKANGDGDPKVDPALLASAKAGNRTAYSILARDAFDGDIKALDAALDDKGDSHDQITNGHDKLNSSNNPFFKLRPNGPNGPVDKAIEAQVGRMIGVMGYRKVADIAKAAKSDAAPLGLSITGMPLKP